MRFCGSIKVCIQYTTLQILRVSKRFGLVEMLGKQSYYQFSILEKNDFWIQTHNRVQRLRRAFTRQVFLEML